MSVNPVQSFVGWSSALGAMVGIVIATQGVVAGQDGEAPDLRLRTTQQVAFAGTELLFIAELTGGDDDYREFYCVTVEWDWDDETRSEMTPDCDPYEPGVSQIRRRFSSRHRFDYPGRYEVRVNLKQRDDLVASSRTTVEVRGRRIR